MNNKEKLIQVIEEVDIPDGSVDRIIQSIRAETRTIDLEEQKGELAKLIDDMARGEWWRTSTPEELLKVGKNMLSRGFSVEETADMLLTVVYAIREEYGDE